jgi:hypothetical protein
MTTEHELENPTRYQSRSIPDVLGSNLRWDPKCPDNLRSFTQSLKEIPGPHLGIQSNVAPPTVPLLEPQISGQTVIGRTRQAVVKTYLKILTMRFAAEADDGHQRASQEAGFPASKI